MSCSRWWYQRVFIFTPKLGEDEPNLTSISFRWVGSSTNELMFWFRSDLCVFFGALRIMDDPPMVSGERTCIT